MLMDSEIREVLRETHELAQENHAMLTKMHRAQVWARVMRFVYWVVVIVAALVGYYILQPFLEGVGDAYNTMRESIIEIKGAADSLPDLSSFFGGGREEVIETVSE
jgi:hypothetical protein